MSRIKCISMAVAVALLAATGGGLAQPRSPARAVDSRAAGGTGQSDLFEQGLVFHIVEWEGGKLPARYDRSGQLPLTIGEVFKLSASQFSDQAIVKMIEERRCTGDVSVDGLIKLKEQGVSETVIQAVSLHALPPNRALYLVITIDFEGVGGEQRVSTQARKGYLYLIIPDGDRERVFIGDLQAVLAGRWQHDSLVDRTDLLLPRKVRRVVFAAEVPLKMHGNKQAMVFTSTRPNIFTSADIPEADRAGVRVYEFDYPASSLQRICDLQVLYRQDAMLPDQWHPVRTNFQCEWD